jgi:hypothetical protein
MRMAFAAVVLIAAVLIAAPYLDFNPILPLFALLGLGIYGLCRGAPALPFSKGGGFSVFGHGVYVDRNDAWVAGQEIDTTYDVNDGAPRDESDRGKH